MDELERIARIIIREAPKEKPRKSHEIGDSDHPYDAYKEGEQYIMWTVAQMLQDAIDKQAREADATD